MAQTAEAFAPAKINLTLHVTGQRTDGYHLLDSLVVFADIGDRITVQAAEKMSLNVVGPMRAGVPTDGGNLVMKAAELLGVPADITLEKHLPAAAGIGGGSSDAAAALRALCDLSGLPFPNVGDLLRLGADVPVCARPGWQRMAGIGETVTEISGGQNWPVLLINPRVEVPTPAVFKALRAKDNPPMPSTFPNWADRQSALLWLRDQRNDLEAPAIEAASEIGGVLSALKASDGCDLARMSGSGATCFGLFADKASCAAAAHHLQSKQPNWWIVPAQILS